MREICRKTKLRLFFIQFNFFFDFFNYFYIIYILFKKTMNQIERQKINLINFEKIFYDVFLLFHINFLFYHLFLIFMVIQNQMKK